MPFEPDKALPIHGIPPRRVSSAFTLIELLVVIASITLLASLLLPSFTRLKESGLSAACRNNLRQIGLALNAYTADFSAYPLSAVYDSGYERAVPGSFGLRPGWPDSLNPYLGRRSKLLYRGDQYDLRQDIFVCPKCSRFNDGEAQIGFNTWGTDFSRDGHGYPVSSLGLGQQGNIRDNSPVRDSRVAAPSEMLAIPHVWYFGGYFGFGWPGIPWPWHRGGELAGFCDGHVEACPSEPIPKKGSSSEGTWVFIPDEAHARRWNIDNEPHRETWPPP